jgi:hypothetical protein
MVTDPIYYREILTVFLNGQPSSSLSLRKITYGNSAHKARRLLTKRWKSHIKRLLNNKNRR